jgi:hypothetical protein
MLHSGDCNHVQILSLSSLIASPSAIFVMPPLLSVPQPSGPPATADAFRKCWVASTADNNLTLHGFRRFKTTQLLNLRFLEDEIANMDRAIYQAGLNLGLSISSTDRLGLKHGMRDAHSPGLTNVITQEFILKLRELVRQYSAFYYLCPTCLR